MGSSLIARLRGSPTWARRPLRPLLPRPPAPQLLPILLPFCSAAPASGAPSSRPPPGAQELPSTAGILAISRPSPRILRHLKRRHKVSMSRGTLQQRRGKPRKPHPREGRWPAAVPVTPGTSCRLQSQPGGQHSGNPFRGLVLELKHPRATPICERDRESRGCEGVTTAQVEESGHWSWRRAGEQKATLHSTVGILDRGHNCPALLRA